MRTTLKKWEIKLLYQGTADYAFKHFAQYWKRYKTIVESQGDPNKLREIFKEKFQKF